MLLYRSVVSNGQRLRIIYRTAKGVAKTSILRICLLQHTVVKPSAVEESE